MISHPTKLSDLLQILKTPKPASSEPKKLTEKQILKLIRVEVGPTSPILFKDLQENFPAYTRLTLASPTIVVDSAGERYVSLERLKSVFSEFGAKKTRCQFCGLSDANLACGGCKVVRYCSEECQSQDWIRRAHKGLCQILNLQRARG